ATLLASRWSGHRSWPQRGTTAKAHLAYANHSMTRTPRVIAFASEPERSVPRKSAGLVALFNRDAKSVAPTLLLDVAMNSRRWLRSGTAAILLTGLLASVIAGVLPRHGVRVSLGSADARILSWLAHC